MYIREIHIKSFRHLHDVHLGPFSQPPGHSDLVALAGPNGGGKSSILELLGYALSNTWSLNWSLNRSFPAYSFEVGIGVTPSERELVRAYLTSSQAASSGEIMQHLDENGMYYREYNYEDGVYQRKAALHNQIHALVTNALRNQYNRPLGFFLKSDRSYPPGGFSRDRLFSYEEIRRREYIWSMAFNTSDVQYRDMFEFLVQQRYHYFRRLGAYHHRLGLGESVAESQPSDPLKPYDELLQELFPGYRFSEGAEAVPSNLFVRLASGETVPFSDLSSGEKEVFFILSFFLRHEVSNAVVVIDEPELHLHPELARLLIRTMQSIKPGNQVWLATHNAEIIDEAGRDRVFYVTRDHGTARSIVTSATDEEEAVRQLRNLFGYSGYIGVAKTIVFLEGMDSSSDRRMFVNLFPEYGRLVKFVPSQTSENLPRINAAILSILESNLGWMQFYLIRDRDFLTPEVVESLVGRFSGRLHVLNRHHIENYLLDEDLIAKVQREIFSRPIEPAQVKEKLRAIALRLSAEVLRDMVAFRLNLVYRPQDFSLGRYMQGESIVAADGSLASAKIAQLICELQTKIQAVNQGLMASTDGASVTSLVSMCQGEVCRAIQNDDDGWRVLFPGRDLLEEYAKAEGLGKPPVLQNSLIKELSTTPERIPAELSRVIHTIAEGEVFGR